MSRSLRRFHSSSDSTPSATGPTTRTIALSHTPRRFGTSSSKASLSTRAEVILGGGLEANRFDLKFGMPGLSQEVVMTNIELYGNRVIPRVHELWADRERQPSPVRGEIG
jgi:hypothetical protein